MSDQVNANLKSLRYAEPPLVIELQLVRDLGLDRAVLASLLTNMLHQKGTVREDGILKAEISTSDILKVAPFWSKSTVNRMIALLIEYDYFVLHKNEGTYTNARLLSSGASL